MSEATLPIIRHLGGAEYELESESGNTYFLNADKPSCTCPHFDFRCREARKLCKHLEMLAEVLESQRVCPLCKGKAWILASFYHAQTGWEPLACSLCEGTGLRSGCDPHFLRIHEEGEAREARESAREAGTREAEQVALR